MISAMRIKHHLLLATLRKSVMLLLSHLKTRTVIGTEKAHNRGLPIYRLGLSAEQWFIYKLLTTCPAGDVLLPVHRQALPLAENINKLPYFNSLALAVNNGFSNDLPSN
jgi:hypothetical protein